MRYGRYCSWILIFLTLFITPGNGTSIDTQVPLSSTRHHHHKSLVHDLYAFSKHKNDLEKKNSATTSKCFVDRNPSTPRIDMVGQIFKRDLPGAGRHITISQYEIQSQATLENNLQFLSNGEWSTVWNAIDFGESPFLPMNFPAQTTPGKWRWELKCVANCNNAKIYSLNTDYCFHNMTSDKPDTTFIPHQIPDKRSLIGGSSSVGCYKQEVPYPVNMDHIGAEHIFSLDGKGRHIRVLRYDLSVNSTIQHKLQFWDQGWTTLWSHAAYGVAPPPPSYIPMQNETSNWRWTLTCIARCDSQLVGLSTDYCLEPNPFSLLSTSTSNDDSNKLTSNDDDSKLNHKP